MLLNEKKKKIGAEGREGVKVSMVTSRSQSELEGKGYARVRGGL